MKEPDEVEIDVWLEDDFLSKNFREFKEIICLFEKDLHRILHGRP